MVKRQTRIIVSGNMVTQLIAKYEEASQYEIYAFGWLLQTNL